MRRTIAFCTLLLMSAALSAPQIIIMPKKKPNGGTFTLVANESSILNTNTAASLSGNYAGNVTAGNLLVLGCGLYPGAISSVTDGGSNTWARAHNAVYQGEMWYTVASTGGFSSVTINFSPDSKATCRLLEFNLSSGTIVRDTHNTATGTSTAPTGPALTPAGANELFIALETANDTPIPTLNWSGATEKGHTVLSGNYGPFGFAYKISTGTAAETPAWTIGSSVAWGVGHAVFKAQ